MDHRMANIMKPRVCIIGTGKIAEFHVPALKAAGFNIVSCCGSPGSLKSPIFAKKYNIPKVFNDADSLISDSDNWDAALICSSLETTFQLLNKCIVTSKPILVEKPVTLIPNDFLSLPKISKNIYVAYNRRFYSTVQFAKKFIESNNPCFIKMELPDSINFSDNNISERYFNVRYNSIHGFDLLNYLMPSIELVRIEKHMQPDGVHSKSVYLKTSRGDSSMIFLNWNAPSNFSINIEAMPYRLELKPFESYSLFKGIDIINASDDFPIRQYVPKLIKTENVFHKSKDFKPGFLEQAIEFKNIVLGGKKEVLATLDDAYRASLLADKIISNNLID